MYSKTPPSSLSVLYIIGLAGMAANLVPGLYSSLGGGKGKVRERRLGTLW